MDDPYKRGIRLEYFTIAYNVLEAVASLFFGGIAGSIALIGFGLDSVVESLSGGVLLWRLRKHETLTEEEEEKVEKKAVKFVAVTFFILGAYVLFESGKKLILQEVPEPSLPGIIIAALSMVIMPLLAHRKLKAAAEIGSKALAADSKETLACALLSVALLLGLGLNYTVGIWWADPIVGLLIVFFLFREGWEGWRGED
ncbi:MAG: Cation efflux family protein [Syntrophorhabdus sp. PtaU1.Bin002]|nr:MAG: Cation efflux family protein [Syntrophorhabdus sp. PtaB.Bin006]OPY71949.1 MAG: Cation efflux family protein [Syntrophorhabdus sp. PtaU1.Bin002]